VQVAKEEASVSDSGSGSENISLYWKTFFTNRPDLLALRSNDEAIAQWKADHGEEAPKNALNGLTNVKSIMRKEIGVKVKKKRGRPRKHPLPATAAAAPAARVVKAPAKLLEALEDQIDKCLGLISGHEELSKITVALKHVRRLAIWAGGE
jgi:hypothetical protein